ncbi:hypothetical protein ACIPPS_30845 [Streptomyces sp. NPDC090127]|uniref:hypothetical protein n=1 Tax=Streptomyces sp. NPDC090127 TaxID=3365953 RepID=UPI00380A0E64
MTVDTLPVRPAFAHVNAAARSRAEPPPVRFTWFTCFTCSVRFTCFVCSSG